MSIMEPLPRIRNISPQEFRDRFLSTGVPVVVEDGTRGWQAAERWSIAYFRQRFGELKTTVQGEFFYEIQDMPFGEYLDLVEEIARRQRSDWKADEQVPYLRYSNFTLAAHAELGGDWGLPYFLPPSGYVWPWIPGQAMPNKRIFPEFGVYVSPRGAFTRFHVDGMRDNAVLCQVQGKKRGFLFAPEDVGDWTRLQPYCTLRVSRTPVALDWIYDGRPPTYGELPARSFELNSGESLFIPKGWAHEVFTFETSISVTFNFVHRSDLNWNWLGFFFREAGRRQTRRLAAGVAGFLGRRR